VASSLITGNVAANKYDLSSGLVTARGGGLYTRDGEAGIFDSLITNNDAYTQQPFNTFTAVGGGVSAGGGIEAKYSQFTHNSAGLGGGLDARGNVVIAHSTISDNDADFNAGAFFDGNATHTLSIRNSTISGNHATSCAAGATLSDFTQAWVSSSTITRNISEGDFNTCGSGVNLQQQIDELRLESTIIAGNTTNGGVPSDLRGTAVIPSIIGTNNLVYESPLMLPPDTISLTPALLGPLAFNGGSTRTHALIEGSPALDAGNNVFNLISDQRGTGFPRVFGPQADIGAFETQGEGPIPDDRIFYNGFGFDEEFGGPGG
jgi:hypothetical protein